MFVLRKGRLFLRRIFLWKKCSCSGSPLPNTVSRCLARRTRHWKSFRNSERYKTAFDRASLQERQESNEEGYRVESLQATWKRGRQAQGLSRLSALGSASLVPACRLRHSFLEVGERRGGIGKQEGARERVFGGGGWGEGGLKVRGLPCKRLRQTVDRLRKAPHTGLRRNRADYPPQSLYRSISNLSIGSRWKRCVTVSEYRTTGR